MTLETKTTSDAQTALEASRQRVESSLGAVRQALHDATGGRVGWTTWSLPLIAAAVGFSVALLMRGRGRASSSSIDDAWD